MVNKYGTNILPQRPSWKAGVVTLHQSKIISQSFMQEHGVVVGSGTALKARKPRVRLPMWSFVFFIDLILLAPLRHWGYLLEG